MAEYRTIDLARCKCLPLDKYDIELSVFYMEPNQDYPSFRPGISIHNYPKQGASAAYSARWCKLLNKETGKLLEAVLTQHIASLLQDGLQLYGQVGVNIQSHLDKAIDKAVKIHNEIGENKKMPWARQKPMGQTEFKMARDGLVKGCKIKDGDQS